MCDSIVGLSDGGRSDGPDAADRQWSIGHRRGLTVYRMKRLPDACSDGRGKSHSYRAPGPKPRRLTMTPSCFRASLRGLLRVIASPSRSKPCWRARRWSSRLRWGLPSANTCSSHCTQAAVLVSERRDLVRLGLF